MQKYSLWHFFRSLLYLFNKSLPNKKKKVLSEVIFFLIIGKQFAVFFHGHNVQSLDIHTKCNPCTHTTNKFKPHFIASFLTVSYQSTYSDFGSSCSEFYIKKCEGVVRIWHS